MPRIDLKPQRKRFQGDHAQGPCAHSLGIGVLTDIAVLTVFWAIETEVFEQTMPAGFFELQTTVTGIGVLTDIAVLTVFC
jgi:hypothetical protein